MALYELREYRARPGEMARMLARFEQLNVPLFERYGIVLEHVWREADGAEVLWFLLRFDDRDARERAWSGYHADIMYLDARSAQAEIIEHIGVNLLEAVRRETLP